MFFMECISEGVYTNIHGDDIVPDSVGIVDALMRQEGTGVR